MLEEKKKWRGEEFSFLTKIYNINELVCKTLPVTTITTTQSYNASFTLSVCVRNCIRASFVNWCTTEIVGLRNCKRGKTRLVWTSSCGKEPCTKLTTHSPILSHWNLSMKHSRTSVMASLLSDHLQCNARRFGYMTFQWSVRDWQVLL